jgi:hypothetical protein
LVAIDQWIEFRRAGKNDMVIIYIKYMIHLGICPNLVRKNLAHRARPVTAGIIVKNFMTAFWA